MLGLKRGTVELMPHQESWRIEAEKAICLLKQILLGDAIDIQHVGSTSISGICAKPIVDIAVGVRDLSAVMEHIPELEQNGIYRKQEAPWQLLFVMGDFDKDIRTHHIHVVIWKGTEWQNYLNFRDYLNAFPEKAAAYERLKFSLADRFSQDRGSYTAGKEAMIAQLVQEAALWR